MVLATLPRISLAAGAGGATIRWEERAGLEAVGRIGVQTIVAITIGHREGAVADTTCTAFGINGRRVALSLVILRSVCERHSARESFTLQVANFTSTVERSTTSKILIGTSFDVWKGKFWTVGKEDEGRKS
jgi:hypothetical protein